MEEGLVIEFPELLSLVFSCWKLTLSKNAFLQARPTTSGEASSVSSSNGLVAEASSNGDNISHQERSDAEVGTILIDSETGEARNARTGETMEMPNSLLPSPRSSTPVAAPSISLYELHQLAVDADIKVSSFVHGKRGCCRLKWTSSHTDFSYLHTPISHFFLLRWTSFWEGMRGSKLYIWWFIWRPGPIWHTMMGVFAGFWSCFGESCFWPWSPQEQWVCWSMM